jgi:copper(I)-binding protein
MPERQKKFDGHRCQRVLQKHMQLKEHRFFVCLFEKDNPLKRVDNVEVQLKLENINKNAIIILKQKQSQTYLK